MLVWPMAPSKCWKIINWESRRIKTINNSSIKPTQKKLHSNWKGHAHKCIQCNTPFLHNARVIFLQSITDTFYNCKQRGILFQFSLMLVQRQSIYLPKLHQLPASTNSRFGNMTVSLCAALLLTSGGTDSHSETLKHKTLFPQITFSWNRLA